MTVTSSSHKNLLSTRPDPSCDRVSVMTAGLTSRELIETWESARNLRPLEQALTLLAAAGCDGDLAAVSLAARDKAILRLREATFGPSFTMIAECPACAAMIELELDVSDLRGAIIETEPEECEFDATTVTVRSLSTGDLLAACNVAEDDRDRVVRDRLVQPSIGKLSGAEIDQLDALVERREQASEILLSLCCIECDHSWSEPYDPISSVWEDVERAAIATLADVADLAAAFGWSENDILAMSDRRRAAYLALSRGV